MSEISRLVPTSIEPINVTVEEAGIGPLEMIAVGLTFVMAFSTVLLGIRLWRRR